MAFLDSIIVFLINFFYLFKDWLYIFISPFVTLDMLWIIVPVWINWFFTEFFQEKEGTHYGNAITNGAVMVWVGIDWIRYLIRLINEDIIKLPALATVSKFILSFVIISIGVFIVYQGINKKQYIRFMGRVRETTYLMVVGTAFIYGAVNLNWRIIGAVVLFAPLFYFGIELINRYLPTPKTYEEDV